MEYDPNNTDGNLNDPSTYRSTDEDVDRSNAEYSDEPVENSNNRQANNSSEDSNIDEADDSNEVGGEHREDPFDPTKIDITTKSLNIDLLVKRLRSNPARIDLNTAFQRGNDLWTLEKQSRLIESLMIRIPLPVFYFDATNDKKWEVVDGLQRLSTLNNFMVSQSLLLTGLEYLTEYNGSNFDSLPEYMKTRIEETEVTAYLINPGTPLNVKHNIFKRINTSGLVLTPQEIRHAVNQGVPADFVKTLSELKEFKDATNGAVKPKRMDDRDFVTRFISFYLTPYMDYKPDLDTFLTNGMAKIAKINELERVNMLEDFKKAMKASIGIFGKDAFRKKYFLGDSKKPVNKALFEVISVTLSKYSQKEINKLISSGDIIRIRLIGLMNNSDFDISISRSTGDVRAVRTRFNEIKKLLNSVLDVNAN